MNRNLLLISNSTNAGEDYLAWPRPHLRSFYHGYSVKDILFVPYAGVNLAPNSVEKSFDVYEKRVAAVFSELGLGIYSVHRESDPVAAVRNAEAIAVGGGNTFHLVKMMHETGSMQAIRERALEGIPYAGWSAGSNVACPTMKTTNDMPISEPSSFNCLNLIPFQINPHYLDANPAGHAGETREQRILEFLTVNRTIYVAGLREGCLLKITGNTMELVGNRPLRIFKFGEETRELNAGEDLGFLLGPQTP
ncbi:MAG: dipeptidase PepE [Bacteroidales bacterium]|nr:dipeptidase PepE [Bacteroidales bacterium]